MYNISKIIDLYEAIKACVRKGNDAKNPAILSFFFVTQNNCPLTKEIIDIPGNLQQEVEGYVSQETVVLRR